MPHSNCHIFTHYIFEFGFPFSHFFTGKGRLNIWYIETVFLDGKHDAGLNLIKYQLFQPNSDAE
jgi:hypothetical protein